MSRVALVVGPPDRRREYVLPRLAEGDRPAVLLPDDPGTLAAEYAALDGPKPLVVAADGPVPDGIEARTVAERTVPAVGEAGLAALAEGADRLWLAAPATALAGDVQGAYRLLYVLTQRVRERGARAWFSLGPDADARTRRILGRAVDDVVTPDGEEPTVGTRAVEGA
ncbi:hypothetical protein [Halosegnis marinus]|uniref:Uncharacterized protein n=1 Tax=Halosegnis marinus TaxID=3034023 RepID=A0ABD5ZL81_9EURY|nr:hypothetical protein [Halosegnis sp. DT85]